MQTLSELTTQLEQCFEFKGFLNKRLDKGTSELELAEMLISVIPEKDLKKNPKNREVMFCLKLLKSKKQVILDELTLISNEIAE